MDYFIYIKSHSEAPDYDDSCQAESKSEAIDIFLKRLNRGGTYVNPDTGEEEDSDGGGWDETMIEKHVLCADCLEELKDTCQH